VEPCIKAGTSERGVCPECGKPWERVIEKTIGVSKECPKTQAAHKARGGIGTPVGTVGKSGSGRTDGSAITLGWRPGCTCGKEPVPATVLDPFFGAGTVGLVASRLGRSWIGIELSHKYVEMARRRIEADAPLLNEVEER